MTQPDPTRQAGDAVDALIARAAEHPLGVAFLKEGALDAVAAIHGVHAFVVDQARERLRQTPRPS
ncbi:MAG: hypothetical protein U0166_28880 [Acidobacteriota bacterium]